MPWKHNDARFDRRHKQKKRQGKKPTSCLRKWVSSIESIISGRTLRRRAATSGHRQGLRDGSEILLADEPTGNLDTETGKKIEDILVNLNEAKQITLVLVTHNKLLAERMSGRIGLRDGKIYDYK